MKDDPDIPFLYYLGVLATKDTSPNQEEARESKLTIKTVKKRLETFLKVFAAVISPKQMYQHQMLCNFYTTLLSSPDHSVVKLALTCILNYKLPFLMPYKDVFQRILDPKTLRDELVAFNPSVASAKIDSSHRSELIPLLIRLLYGRSVAKAGGNKAREQSLSRYSIRILAYIYSI